MNLESPQGNQQEENEPAQENLEKNLFIKSLNKKLQGKLSVSERAKTLRKVIQLLEEVEFARLGKPAEEEEFPIMVPKPPRDKELMESRLKEERWQDTVDLSESAANESAIEEQREAQK